MTHENWMALALAEAKKAQTLGEVPVGCIVVKDNKLIGTGFNQPIYTHDPSAHAEIIAMRTAGQQLNNYRLVDCTLYVTLEPCAMCAMAMVHARIKHLVYGAFDRRTGAVDSVINITNNQCFNHAIDVKNGILEQKCSQILTKFFQHKRKIQKEKLNILK